MKISKAKYLWEKYAYTYMHTCMHAKYFMEKYWVYYIFKCLSFIWKRWLLMKSRNIFILEEIKKKILKWIEIFIVKTLHTFQNFVWNFIISAKNKTWIRKQQNTSLLLTPKWQKRSDYKRHLCFIDRIKNWSTW